MFRESLHPVQYCTDEGCPNYTVMVAVIAITFVVVQRDDVGNTHVLGHGTFMTALRQELVQVVKSSTFASLDDLRGESHRRLGPCSDLGVNGLFCAHL